MRISTTPEMLPMQLDRLNDELKAAIPRGAFHGMQRGRSILVRRTPVDQGQLKAGWRVTGAVGGQPALVNDAPHAGIVEMGARPHPTGRAGIDALTAWAQRKLGLSPADAKGVAFAIAARLQRVGQKPTYFVRGAMPQVTEAVALEIVAELERVAARGGK